MRIWTRTFALLTLLLIGSASVAETPKVSVAFEDDPVNVGQPFILRLKVLVPTFMPQPPVFPTFETPGLIIKLPARSSSPISERIDGATWAGVSRTYRIYPTTKGQITLPIQDVVITYKDPETNEDVRHVEPSPEISFTATIPDGARGLNPLILADGLQITQEWEAPEGQLAVGDAIVRRLKAQITGTSALFVPDLLDTNPVTQTPAAQPNPPSDPDAPETAKFATYPQEPTLNESFDRGILSGTRTLQATYVAQTGGQAEAPEINLSWFNLKTNTVETITLAGREFDVAPPPPEPFNPDPKDIATAVLWGLVAIFVVWILKQFAWPRMVALWRKGRLAYQNTPHAARNRAVKAAQSKDLTLTLADLSVLEQRLGHQDPEVTEALRSLTQTLYSGSSAPNAPPQEWRALRQAISKTNAPLRLRKNIPALPALNPASKSASS